MVIFECNVCRTALSAEEAQAGQLVRCPKCMTTLRVPSGARETVAAGAPSTPSLGRPPEFSRGGGGTALGSAGRGGGRRFGFNCGYCSSRLEATEGDSGNQGQCPTCGNSIIIPILDRYGRLIDPMTGKIIKPDPHPVHAYAAAGERAPRILRSDDGRQTIMCPRCQALSPVSANNCKSCGMPFTMEGTTLEASGTSNGFCVAALVLGILGVFAFICFPLPILAIIFGAIGYAQVSRSGGGEGGGKGMAIAGMVLGGIGCAIAVVTRL